MTLGLFIFVLSFTALDSEGSGSHVEPVVPHVKPDGSRLASLSRKNVTETSQAGDILGLEFVGDSSDFYVKYFEHVPSVPAQQITTGNGEQVMVPHSDSITGQESSDIRLGNSVNQTPEFRINPETVNSDQETLRRVYPDVAFKNITAIPPIRGAAHSEHIARVAGAQDRGTSTTIEVANDLEQAENVAFSVLMPEGWSPYERLTALPNEENRSPAVVAANPKLKWLEIRDPWATPEITFDIVSNLIVENDITINVKVRLSSPAPAGGLTLEYSLGGTAKNRLDYNSSGSVSVAGGASFVNIPVTIIDDSLVESAEEVILKLKTSQIIATTTVSPNPVDEGDTVTVMVHLSEALDRDVRIRINTAGSIERGDGNDATMCSLAHPYPNCEFKQLWGSRTQIKAGETSAQVGKIATYDVGRDKYINVGYIVSQLPKGVCRPPDIRDFTPIVRVRNVRSTTTEEELPSFQDTALKDGNIAGASNCGEKYTVGSASKHILTIVDNDGIPGVSFALSEESIGEDVGTHHIRVDFSSAAPAGGFTLNYDVNGSAIPGSNDDYTIPAAIQINSNATSAVIPIEIIDDKLVETTEEVILTLKSGTGYTVGSTKRYELTIIDDDKPEIEFAIPRESVNEDVGIYDVKVNLKNPAPTGGFTFSYIAGFTSTATAGQDYTVQNSNFQISFGDIFVPANETQAIIPVKILEDTKGEPDETISLTLVDTHTHIYTVGTVGSFVLTIIDNDVPEATFAKKASKVKEDAGTHNVTVNLSSAAPVGGFDLNYTVATKSEAITPDDYRIRTPSPVKIKAGETSVDIKFFIENDTKIEPSETVILTLTGGTGYTVGSRDEHTLTIIDDDLPVAKFALSSENVPEAAGTHDVTVTISSAPATDLTLTYSVGGDATEDKDYSIDKQRKVTIKATESSAEIPVTIINDDVDEPSETVILTLMGGTGYTIGSPGNHTLTIIDDDLLPVVNFALSSSSSLETAGTHNVTVTINSAPAADLALTYSVGGTATGSDYSIVNAGTVTIQANKTSAVIPVTIVNDTEDDDDETIILTLTDDTKYTVGIPDEHTLTIIDDDLPDVTFDLESSRVNEDADKTYVTVNISPAPVAGFTLTYDLTGTADKTDDYEIENPGTISVAAGTSSVDIPVKIIDDIEEEDAETVVMTLTNDSDYTVGIPKTHTLTITASDITVTWSADRNPVYEGETVTLSMSLSKPLPIERNLDGHPEMIIIELVKVPQGADRKDYIFENPDDDPDVASWGLMRFFEDTKNPGFTLQTASIPLKIRDDDGREGEEKLVWRKAYTTGWTSREPLIAKCKPLTEPECTFEITIRENPTVSLSANSNSVNEGESVTITAEISKAQSGDVTIPLTITGTATEDDDYLLPDPESITITGDGTNKKGTVTISTVQDEITEGNEKFTVAIDEGGLQTNHPTVFAGNPSDVSIMIIDDDLPEINFALSSSSALETAGTHEVTVTINSAPAADLALTYSVGGTATGSDYSIVNAGTVTIQANKTSAVIPVTIVNDTEDDDDKTIILTLTDDTKYTVGSPKSHTVTIVDDDLPEVQFASPSSSVDEAAGTHEVTVTINSAPAADLTLLYSVSGTATGSDYSIDQQGTVIIKATETSSKIPVTIVNDNVDDDNETIIFTLTGGTGYTVGSPGNHTLTITEKPTVTLSASPNPVDEGESVTVKVTLSRALSNAVTIPVMVTPGSTEPGDYSHNLTAFTISAGETEDSGTIVTNWDNDADEERFSVVLGTLPPQLRLNKGEVTIIIRDRDKPTTLRLSATTPVKEGDPVTVTATLSATLPGPVTIPITLGHGGALGTAEAGDYGTGLTQITIAANQPAGTGTIPTFVDTDTDDETFTVALGTLPSEIIDAFPRSVLVRIEDTDRPPDSPPTVYLSAIPTSVTEGGVVSVELTLSRALPDPVTIPLTDIPGSATEPNDYVRLSSIDIPAGSRTGTGDLLTNDDDVYEGDETFEIAIDTDRLPSTVLPGSPLKAQITIIDDDTPPPVEVMLSVDPQAVIEGNPFTVTATLTGALETDVTIPLNYINYEAEAGDYTPLPQITVSSGQTEGSGQIGTIPDADIDDETFVVALQNPLPPELRQGRPFSQLVTIHDRIPPKEVTVRLSASPDPVNEGDPVTVTVELSDPLPGDVTIPLSVTGGTATAQDYHAPTPAQVVIKAEDTNGSYVIATVQDKIDEADEAFTVALGTLPSGVLTGNPSRIAITITDDDDAGINLPPSISVAEGGTETFTFSLNSEPPGRVNVEMTWPPGTDLTLTPPARSFTPDNWDQMQQVTLHAAEDPDFNHDHIAVTLKAIGVGYTGVSETIHVTIIDNDEPGIVAPVSITVPEGGIETVELRLAQKPSGTVTVTVPGPAGDLTASPLSLTFTPDTWQTLQEVTLRAGEDDDVVDDTEILRLTASGGGYAGVTHQMDVRIIDNDEAGIEALEEVTIMEGSTAAFQIRLLAQPSGSVTITLSGHAGTDLTLDRSSLTFTAADWQTPQTVNLTAAEDDTDYVNEQIPLTLSASGGGFDGTGHTTRVTIVDNDERLGPLTISIWNQQGYEDAGSLQLPIELNRPAEEIVTVQYASSDVDAEAGLDYTASRGIVIFDPGATRGVIEIEVIADQIPEPDETFQVTLSEPSENVQILQAVGIGTIRDDDGNAMLRVEDALVQEKAGAVQFRVSLSYPQRRMVTAEYRTRDGTAKAGEDYESASGVVMIAPGTTESLIAVRLLKEDLDWEEETFTMHLESAKHAGIEKAVGVATIQESMAAGRKVLDAYVARFVRTASVQVVDALGGRFRRAADGAMCAAAERAEMAQLWYSASSWDPSFGELLAGCRMSQSMPLSSGSLSIWGQGAFRQFNGQGEDALTLRGEMTTGMLGADYRWRTGWMAGVLFAHSRGDGSFEMKEESGDLTSALTGIYPYVSYTRAGWEVWASAGAGRGNAEVLELKGDLTSRFGALGMQGTLVSGGTSRLRYHGDILVTDAEIKEHNITAEVYRIRAGLEASTQITSGIRPYVEANVRQDGGSAETGTGLELGGGVRFANPAWHLRGEVRTQGLVMHTADGFTEWGVSGSLQMGSGTEGLMMRLRPSWGRGQGMSMYRQQTILDAVPLGTDMYRTELELGYGIPWKEGSVRSIAGMTRLPQGRMYRLGGELRPWEQISFSVFGLANGHKAALGDLGVNVQGALRY